MKKILFAIALLMISSSAYAADLAGNSTEGTPILRSTELSEGVVGTYFSVNGATDRTNYAAATYHPNGETIFYGLSTRADIPEGTCTTDPCANQTMPTTYAATVTAAATAAGS